MLDLTGHRYGHFVVLRLSHVGERSISYWTCRCDCGREKTVALNNLRSGNSTTCGCRHGVFISDPITQDQLKQLLSYDPDTGKFHWLVTIRNAEKGSEAGHFNEANGYVRISFDGRSYYAHQLAWLYMTGEWPTLEVDHKDVDGQNNRWDNLRLATHSENSWNTGVTSRSKSGYKGVSKAGRKFTAKIRKHGIYHELGSFDDPIAAAKAYDTAARKLHGEFARTNFEVTS